jgi:hypothetical protein
MQAHTRRNTKPTSSAKHCFKAKAELLCPQVSHLDGLPYDPESMLIKALSNEVVSTIRELIKVNPLFKEHFNFYTQKIDVADPFRVRLIDTGEMWS